MAVFPTFPSPRVNGNGGSTQYLVIKSNFEGNYSQTRRGATRGIETFDLSYEAITNDEYATLKAFFDANVGGSFIFVHPQTAASHIVRFGMDKITYKSVSTQRVSTNIVLEEV